jgi:hypothetical protein
LSSYVLQDAPRFYREKVTGAHNDRRELLDMLKHLAPGDTVIVTRIDRLARSTFYLFGIVKRSWMPRRNSDPRRNRGPTPFPHHTRATQKAIRRRKALCCKNWRTVTTSAYPPFAARRGQHDQ